MVAGVERRKLDVEKLRALQQLSGGKVVVTDVVGDPVDTIHVAVTAKTSGSKKYPNDDVITSFSFKITLPSRYPFDKPRFDMTSEIFHPHVSSSGWICIGDVWQPSEALDQVVRRMIDCLTYDPQRINTSDPANLAARDWYQSALVRHPGHFPSDKVSFSVSSGGGSRRRSWGTSGSGEQSSASRRCWSK